MHFKRTAIQYTSDLTDKQWQVIEPLVSYIGPCRPRKYTIREVLNAILGPVANRR